MINLQQSSTGYPLSLQELAKKKLHLLTLLFLFLLGSSNIQAGNHNGIEDGFAASCNDQVSLIMTPRPLTDTNGDGAAGNVGDQITYDFRIENMGNCDLDNVTVSFPAGSVSGTSINILPPGDVDDATFTGTYTITSTDFMNGFASAQATVTASTSDGGSVSDLSDNNSNSEDDPTTVVVDDSPCAANPFNIALTTSDESCSGNAEIRIDITGTEAGAEFTFEFYKLPDTSTPVRVINGITAPFDALTHTETNFTSGDYQVVATQVVCTTNSNNEQANITIQDISETLAFTASLTPTCTGGIISANVTAGFPATYELRDDMGNVVVAAQSSNTFPDQLPGDYLVVVTDECGDVNTLSASIPTPSANYTFGWNSNVYGFNTLNDCSSFNHIVRVQVNHSHHNIPEYVYPIQVTYEVEDPSGGPSTFLTQTMNSSADNNFSLDVPFYPGETYTVTRSLVDACGNTYTEATRTVNGQMLVRFDARTTTDCGTRYLRNDKFQKAVAPITIEYTAYPAGFDPADYNTDFAPGTYTANFATIPPHANIGDATTSVPDGSYTIRVTDACGQVFEKTITASTPSLILTARRVYAGCADNEGGVSLYFRSSASSLQAADITSISITSAPAAYTGPTNIDFTIAADGTASVGNLPAGDYTFEATSVDCAATSSHTVTIPAVNLTSSVDVRPGCGSFGVDVEISSALGDEEAYLQKYNAATDSWEHPETGAAYTEGTKITTTTGMQILNDVNNSGFRTLSGSVDNVIGTGLYRVILQSRTIGDAGNLIGDMDCFKTLKTFNIPTNNIYLNDYYVTACTGSSELIVDAVGAEPLNYEITAFDGTPISIDNGTDPIFSGLSSGAYTVEVSDACGNVRQFQLKTVFPKPPRIIPNGICGGQNGELTIPGLDFLDISWTKQGDPTVLATGNSLSFNPYNDPADAGTYIASLSSPGNPAACINQDLTFDIPAGGLSAVNAGADQTVDIGYSQRDIFNLFDFLDPTADSFGTWSEVTNSGEQNGDVWDATNLPEGNYIFDYTIIGCASTEVATITVNIKTESDLEVNKSVNNTTPVVGHEVVFTINASNNGVADDSAVEVQDVLPSGYTYVNHTTSSGTYDANTGVWNLGSFTNGATATLDVTATVNATGDYENIATISGENIDPDNTNNESSATTTPIAKPSVDTLRQTIFENYSENICPPIDPSLTNPGSLSVIHSDNANASETAAGQCVDVSGITTGTDIAHVVICDQTITALCDTTVIITEVLPTYIDYSDAPSYYSTAWHYGLLDDNGNNTPDMAGAVWLGTGLSLDADSLASETADADSNDDAISFGNNDGQFPTNLQPNTTFNLDIVLNSTNPTTVHYGLWIDYNNDGKYDQFYTGSGDTQSPVTVSQAITTPSDLPTTGAATVNIRLRAGTSPFSDSDVIGGMLNGEVEDYQSVIVLPVELLYFQGKAEDCYVQLEWATASEENNSHFLVEYSSNGTDFQTVGSVEGMGNSAEEVVYSFTDRPQESKAAYYRLKQVDFDGAFEYSDIISLETNCASEIELKSYPNPVHSQMNIELNGGVVEEGTKVSVFNMNGVLLQHKTFDSDAARTATFDVSDYPNGMYILILESPSSPPKSLKFMKQ